MKKPNQAAVLMSLLTVGLLVGCASQQPLSSYARTGDTVAIALGGTDTHAQAPVLKKENLLVRIKDSSAASYPVKVRNLIRIYSDPTSRYDITSIGEGGFDSFVKPHQGEWIAVLDLVDPTTGNVLPIQPGAASLSVSSPELQNYDPTGYGWGWTNGNLAAIPIEVLPGQGAPNPLSYMQPITTSPLNELEPQPQIAVVPSGTPSTLVGGGSFTFSYISANFGSPPRVVPFPSDPNVQLSFTRNAQADGTVLLNVMIMNPKGFNINNTKYDANTGANILQKGSSLLRSLGFNIAWDANGSTVTDSDWQSSLTLVSAKYVDINGNTMPELTPTLTKTR